MITTDAAGLPHCDACRGDALCRYHRAQVTAALNGLVTARVLARETDVAPLLRSRRLGRRMDAE
jgi:hypothetical protein